MKLARLLSMRLPHGVTTDRSLDEVRIYTGRPSSAREPKSYGAHMKQCANWEKSGATVVARPLRYLTGRPPEQKGVDVELAVDYVTMAVEGKYDVGIIFSTDTDLKPALEYVVDKGLATAEVACWWSEKAQRYLSISSAKIWSHRLTEADYKSVCDHTDYNR
jgi:uncharacterized LabA/DUF88 family protein